MATKKIRTKTKMISSRACKSSRNCKCHLHRLQNSKLKTVIQMRTMRFDFFKKLSTKRIGIEEMGRSLKRLNRLQSTDTSKHASKSRLRDRRCLKRSYSWTRGRTAKSSYRSKPLRKDYLARTQQAVDLRSRKSRRKRRSQFKAKALKDLFCLHPRLRHTLYAQKYNSCNQMALWTIEPLYSEVKAKTSMTRKRNGVD